MRPRLLLAALASLAVVATVQAADLLPRVSKLDDRAFNALALSAESQVREQRRAAHRDDPLRFDFHRAQAFVAQTPADAWQVTSIAWWPEQGGPARCALVVARPAAGGRPLQPLHFDALAGGEQAWDCDGAPALKFVAGESGHWRVIALYTFRAPSGAHFAWPLVVACPTQASSAACSVDDAGTRRLHEAVEAGRPIDTLAQAQRLLIAEPSGR